MATIDVSALTEELKRNRKDYGKLFMQRFASLKMAKADFVMMPMKAGEETVLVRDFVSNITQPGKTGATNYITALTSLKQRIAKAMPIKADIRINELEMVAIEKSYIGKKEPSDPRDIHSLPGASYLMGRVVSKMEGEVAKAFYKGVYNAGTGVVGGLNLFDGFEQLIVAGYTVVGSGGVEDIPATHKVASPAGSVTSSNVIAEMRKFIEVIISAAALEEFRNDDGSIFMDFAIWAALIEAQENSVTNRDQVATKGPDGVYRLNLLPNIALKPRTWMAGTGNMFFSVDGNLFYLYRDEADMEGPSIKFQEADRDLKILIDGEASVNYADGRLIAVYK